MYWSLIFSILNYLLRFGSHIGDAVCNGPLTYGPLTVCALLYTLFLQCFQNFSLLLHFFGVELFSCCTFSMLRSFMFRYFRYTLFSCCTFFMLIIFRVTLFPCCPFSILHSFYFSLFLSFFMFSSCYTFFKSHIFGVALY